MCEKLWTLPRPGPLLYEVLGFLFAKLQIL